MKVKNVFESVGFGDPEEKFKKTLLIAKSREDAVDKAAERIRQELNQLGDTEKSISEATGVKRSHVRRLLAGEFQKFTLSQLVDIALLIDLDIELRFRKPKPTKPVTK